MNSKLRTLAYVAHYAPWAGCMAPEYLQLEVLGLVSPQNHCGGVCWRPTKRGWRMLRTAPTVIGIVEHALRVGPLQAARRAA